MESLRPKTRARCHSLAIALIASKRLRGTPRLLDAGLLYDTAPGRALQCRLLEPWQAAWACPTICEGVPPFKCIAIRDSFAMGLHFLFKDLETLHEQGRRSNLGVLFCRLRLCVLWVG